MKISGVVFWAFCQFFFSDSVALCISVPFGANSASPVCLISVYYHDQLLNINSTSNLEFLKVFKTFYSRSLIKQKKNFFILTETLDRVLIHYLNLKN